MTLIGFLRAQLQRSRTYRTGKDLIALLAARALIRYFFRREIGREYGVTFSQKLKLVWTFQRNVQRIRTASSWLEHLELAARILSIPREIQGDIIECGCFKGGSTTNLSLACCLVGRKLVVCDSFAGLPKPADDDKFHFNEYSRKGKTYEEGQYQGYLLEVQGNIRRYGRIDVCEFVQGYFRNTLPRLADRRFAFIFLDVDLNESLKACLKHLWPRLQEGCSLYSHEAQDLAFISLFFDKAWWQSQLGTDAPGFVGAGCGLPLGVRQGCFTGYAIKRKQLPAVRAAA